MSHAFVPLADEVLRSRRSSHVDARSSTIKNIKTRTEYRLRARSTDHVDPSATDSFLKKYYCRVWARQGPIGSLQHCASVCVSVCSLHKCMSFKQHFEWRLHVTSRPKLLVKSCPVVVAHSLPAGFDCAPISWFVASHSVPGCLNRYHCSLELATQMCQV